MLIDRALADERGLGGAVALDADAPCHLVRLSGRRRPARADRPGGRRGAAIADGKRTDRRSRGSSRRSTRAAVRYDRDGDQHYDVISAFIKSIRGLATSTPRCTTWPG